MVQLARMKSKIIVLLIIIASMLIGAIYLQENRTKININDLPTFITENDGLYAATKLYANTTPWQKWQSYSGINARTDCKYFFVPQNSKDNYIEIYNNYPKDIKVGDVKINSKEYKEVKYEEGKEIVVLYNNEKYNLIILKSDAESSIFISDSSESYKNFNGEDVSTDLYSFLTQDKKNIAKDIKCTIVNNKEVLNTSLKKIKGRGNSTWGDQENKPFNIAFYNKTLIGHTISKKFAIISNGCDPTMLRNKIMYDLADEVGLPYSPNISYIDLFVNGIYKGCYLACEKVDMGNNSLVSLKDTSDKIDFGFNFLVEIDNWNYYEDTYFTTNRGYNIVLKTPNLDGYNGNDEHMKLKFDFIKNTYQNFENVLYNGTLEELEKICDIQSLATMYLIQEISKNCDGGLTSTYFTYNAEEKKFYAVPVWDFDSALGVLDIIKEGYTVSTCNYKDWITKYATYKGIINPLGQCFKIEGSTSNGKTFEQICQNIWNKKFMPSIDILLGKEKTRGRLNSIDEYKENYKKAINNNYIMWNIRLYSTSYASRLEKVYNEDYDGEIEYLKDWIQARANWINSTINNLKIENQNVEYYLIGENLGGWEDVNDDNKLIKGEDGLFSITKTFKANVEYQFKIKNSNNEYYHPNFYDDETLKYCNIRKEFSDATFCYEKDTILTIKLDGDYFYIIPTLGNENTPYPISIPKKEIYFKNTAGWDNVYCFSNGNEYESSQWPGEKAEFVKKDDDGFDIYKAIVYEDTFRVIFNSGGIEEKTDFIYLSNYTSNSIYVPKNFANFRTFKVWSVDEIQY